MTLSPPIRFRSETVPTDPLTKQLMVTEAMSAAFGIRPLVEIRVGTSSPQVGSWSRMHSTFVAVNWEASREQEDLAK